MTHPLRPGTDAAVAAARLRAGGLVAFGTETVYGLGANALDADAVARVFAVKDRPAFDPLIVHVAERDWLDDLVTEVPAAAAALIESFWPGPLTLVLPKRERVPYLVTAGLGSVAVRQPAHAGARALIAAAGVPVAAPSANRFGRLSPTTAADVVEQLGDRLDPARDAILDFGPCRVGVESTVVEVTPHGPRLLRPGGLSLEAIEAVVGPVAIPEEREQPVARAQPSPGMLPRHYAPRTPVVVVPEGEPLPPGRLGLLTLVPPVDADRFTTVEVLSPTGDLGESATRFFAALRRLDAANVDHIVARPFPERDLGRALNDRLRRAAR
jgi:L-threonylcarbamoyladenylate synthase